MVNNVALDNIVCTCISFIHSITDHHIYDKSYEIEIWYSDYFAIVNMWKEIYFF
jgi:hypothetical protein